MPLLRGGGVRRAAARSCLAAPRSQAEGVAGRAGQGGHGGTQQAARGGEEGPGAPGAVKIILGVTEQSTGSLSGGIGYSQSQGVFGQIGIQDTNLFGNYCSPFR